MPITIYLLRRMSVATGIQTPGHAIFNTRGKRSGYQRRRLGLYQWNCME